MLPGLLGPHHSCELNHSSIYESTVSGAATQISYIASKKEYKYGYVLNVISIVDFILNNLPVTVMQWKIKKSVYHEKERILTQ